MTAVNVHDSTLYVGDSWSPEDNFDSAIDRNGNPVDFSNITVSGSVDTSKAGDYHVTYSYDNVSAIVSAIATITVKEPADTTAPDAPTVSNVTGNSTNGYTVTGTAEPGSTVTIKDKNGAIIGTGTASSTGAYSINISGSVGPNAPISVTATDAAGNVSNPTLATTPADRMTSVNVNFVVNGTTKTVVVVAGGLLQKPETPIREGFTFLGWFREDGRQWDFDNDRVGDTSFSLVARWKPNIPNNKGKQKASFIVRTKKTLNLPLTGDEALPYLSLIGGGVLLASVIGAWIIRRRKIQK